MVLEHIGTVRCLAADLALHGEDSDTIKCDLKLRYVPTLRAPYLSRRNVIGDITRHIKYERYRQTSCINISKGVGKRIMVETCQESVVWTGLFTDGTRITIKSDATLIDEESCIPPGAHRSGASFIEFAANPGVAPSRVYLHKEIEGSPLITTDGRGTVSLLETKTSYMIALVGQPAFSDRPTYGSSKWFPVSRATYDQALAEASFGETMSNVFNPKVFVYSYDKKTNDVTVYSLENEATIDLLNSYFSPQLIDEDTLICLKYTGAHNGMTCCFNMTSDVVIMKLTKERFEQHLLEDRKICSGQYSWIRYADKDNGVANDEAKTTDMDSDNIFGVEPCIVMAVLRSPMHFGVLDIVAHSMSGSQEKVLATGANAVELNLFAYKLNDKIITFYQSINEMRQYVNIVVDDMKGSQNIIGQLLCVVRGSSSCYMLVYNYMENAAVIWDVYIDSSVDEFKPLLKPLYTFELCPMEKPMSTEYRFHYSPRNKADGKAEYGYICSKRYQTVKLFMIIHGGPHVTQYLEKVMSSMEQKFLDTEYAIGMVNYTGSNNSSYEDLINSVPMTGAVQASECEGAARAICKELGLKLEHTVIYGGSHGGFLTCYLANQDIGAGAYIAVNPVTNFYTMLHTTDIPSWPFLTQEGLDAGFKGDTCVGEIINNNGMTDFKDNNIVLTTENVTKPFLMIVGTDDKRVPCHQGITWYKSLKSRDNCPDSKLLIYPGVGHSLRLSTDHIWLDLEIFREIHKWSHRANANRE